MLLFAALTAEQTAAAEIAVAVVLGTLGLSLLLPRPQGRSVLFGTFFSIAALAVLAGFLLTTFANPTSDEIAQGLFWLFTTGAVVFGTMLVTQANPGRGAMAFAFVILCTCGLFLLLAAPFLMAATIIIYAGAIIVTFLFVLMLSHAKGPSDENDRSREPFLGSLAGFAFTGLVLFTLYLSSPATDTTATEKLLPSAITSDDRRLLLQAAADLKFAASQETSHKDILNQAKLAQVKLATVVGRSPGEAVSVTGSQRPLQERLKFAETDARTKGIIDQADRLKLSKKFVMDKLVALQQKPDSDLTEVKSDLTKLREDTLVLAGRSLLPARNVSAIGLALYSEHLIAVELAGTLLLVATIGAVAIAGRKGVKA